MTISQITREALELEAGDRATLARILISTLDEDTDELWLQNWAAEAQKRYDDVRNGKTVSIPNDEVVADIRSRLAHT